MTEQWTPFKDGRPICGARMANDYKRRSGRTCWLLPGHAGQHVSQFRVTDAMRAETANT